MIMTNKIANEDFYEFCDLRQDIMKQKVLVFMKQQ